MTKQQQQNGRALIAALIETERAHHRDLARLEAEVSEAKQALSLALHDLPQKSAARTFAVTASLKLDTAVHSLEESAKGAQKKLEELARLYNQGA